MIDLLGVLLIFKGIGIDKLILFFVLISHFKGCACQATEIPWGYQASNGPSLWCSLQEKCCGKRQSPIHIDTTKVQVVPDLPPVSFQSYEAASDFKMKASHTGFTVMFHPQLEVGTNISGGCFKGVYVLEQFHFHWGSFDKQGSEHAVDNKFFPLEMHLLHRNEAYQSLTEALKHKDGIVVLSVLFEVDSADANPTYGFLADQLDQVAYKNTEHEFQFPGTLKSLLPANTDEFFCYPGSLTTPACEEAVFWIVFKDHVYIDPKFLDRLRDLYRDTNDVEKLADNFRHVQPLNGREVKARLSTHKQAEATPTVNFGG